MHPHPPPVVATAADPATAGQTHAADPHPHLLLLPLLLLPAMDLHSYTPGAEEGPLGKALLGVLLGGLALQVQGSLHMGDILEPLQHQGGIHNLGEQGAYHSLVEGLLVGLLAAAAIRTKHYLLHFMICHSRRCHTIHTSGLHRGQRGGSALYGLPSACKQNNIGLDMRYSS